MPIANYDAKLVLFCAWLQENGATYPKIEWPSTDTVGGCRGAKAKSRIDTNEVMMEIPAALMMSPMHAFADPVLGPVFSGAQDLLRGDMLLTVYIMSELLKGSSSFYAPYLNILPESGSIIQWTDAQLNQLEDPNLLYRTRTRGKMLKNTYERTFNSLYSRFPDAFPTEQYTHELFLFAWFCVQARAFGRRLPWTALVPFADCLNHANVQTKYDYNIEGNGVFRMFPTGNNFYSMGGEVFNSYGRRPNDNLLLDYGFAILDNMWDAVEVPLGLLTLEGESPYSTERKKRLLYAMGHHPNSVFPFRRTDFPIEAINFARIAMLNDAELEYAEQRLGRLREKELQDNKATEAAAAVAVAAKAAISGVACGGAVSGEEGMESMSEDSSSDSDFDFDSETESDSGQGGASRASETAEEKKKLRAEKKALRTPPRTENASSAMGRGVGVISASSELMAVLFVKSKIAHMQKDWGFSAAEDMEFLQLLKDRADASAEEEEEGGYGKAAVVDDGSTDGEEWKMISAVTYRLTRKHILEATVRKLELVECFLRGLLAKKKAAQAVTKVLAGTATEAAESYIASGSGSMSTSTDTKADNSLCPAPIEPPQLTAVELAPAATPAALVEAALPLPAPLPVSPPRPKQGLGLSPSRQIFEEMKRIDAIYSVNQPSSGVSPYVTTGSSTAFRGGSKSGGAAGAAGDGVLNKQEMQLRSYLQKVTNESLVLSIG